MENELGKFKTRWLRWLGQKTRIDRDCWVDLLDCNWSGWASKVLDRTPFDDLGLLGVLSSREDVKKYYSTAIQLSNMDDLRKLDNLYASTLIK